MRLSNDAFIYPMTFCDRNYLVFRNNFLFNTLLDDSIVLQRHYPGLRNDTS
jgi:hypothetical protein